MLQKQIFLLTLVVAVQENLVLVQAQGVCSSAWLWLP